MITWITAMIGWKRAIGQPSATPASIARPNISASRDHGHAPRRRPSGRRAGATPIPPPAARLRCRGRRASAPIWRLESVMAWSGPGRRPLGAVPLGVAISSRSATARSVGRRDARSVSPRGSMPTSSEVGLASRSPVSSTIAPELRATRATGTSTAPRPGALAIASTRSASREGTLGAPSRRGSRVVADRSRGRTGLRRRPVA